MKKIAIYLTGLIQDRTHVLPHVKQSFDYIAKALDLEIDYYCHFWDTSVRYPYTIDDTDLIVGVSCENKENISTCIEVFNPVNYTVASFMDYFPHFLKIVSVDPHNTEGYCNIEHFFTFTFDNFDINSITNVVIDKNFFLNNELNGIENAGHIFNQWWELHTLWSTFVLEASQGISMSNCNKMIVSSGKQYDACFKSRYDLLFNYSDLDFLNIFNSILELAERNTDSVILESVWFRPPPHHEVLESCFPHQLQIDNAIDIHEFGCTSDFWWAHDMSTAQKLANSLLDDYCSSMVLRTAKWNSQHAYYYRAFRKSNLVVRCPAGKLSTGIIRSNVEIPKNYHLNTTAHFTLLNNQFLNRDKSDDSEKCYHRSGITAKYYTIGQFNFDIFKKK